MAQSATTVTPGNPTPPTNLSCVGARPPLDPAQAAVDDGIAMATPNATSNAAANGNTLNEPSGNRNVFAAKTAAAGSGTSNDAEGKGAETLFTQTYSSSIYAPIALTMDGCGPAYTTTPNQSHASSLSPATNPTLSSISPTSSVHGSAAITMTATGVGFTPQSVITIGGVPQKTTFVSSTSLTCTATPGAAAGSTPVTVVTGGVVTTAPQTWTFT